MSIYIGRDGKQEGPYTLEEIRAMLGQGRIRPQMLAWKNGMKEWRMLSEVLETAEGAPALPGYNPDGIRTTPASDAGHFSTNAEFLADAEVIAKDRYGLAFGAHLVSGLIEGVCGALPCGIGFVARIVLCGPFEWGRVAFDMKFARRAVPAAEIGDIFEGLKTFGRSMGVFWYMMLFFFLWSLPGLAFAVPGMMLLSGKSGAAAGAASVLLLLVGWLYLIIAWLVLPFRYALYLMLARDNESEACETLLNRSIAMMDGHKWRLFSMYFSLMWKPFVVVYLCMSAGIGGVFGAIESAKHGSSGAPLWGLIAFVAICGGLVALYYAIRAQIRVRVAKVRFYDELVRLSPAVRTGASPESRMPIDDGELL